MGLGIKLGLFWRFIPRISGEDESDVSTKGILLSKWLSKRTSYFVE